MLEASFYQQKLRCAGGQFSPSIYLEMLKKRPGFGGSRTIRRRQFGADNSAQRIYCKFYRKSRFHSAIFFSSNFFINS